MHIVFLSPHSDPESRPGDADSGGQCIYELELGKALTAIPDISVTIYCRKKNGHLPVSIINDRFLVKRVVCGGDEYIPKEELDPYIDEFAKKVAEDLKTPPDIFHGHYWDGGKAVILTAWHLKAFTTPLIWTPHSLGSVKRQNFEGQTNEMRYNFVPRVAWESYAMLASDLVIASTLDERHRIVSQYSIPEENIRIIAPGVDPRLFKPGSKVENRKKLGLPVQSQIILSLGRLDRRKGYHHSIRAFAEYLRLFKKDAHLLILAGKEKSKNKDEEIYRTELKELAEQLGVGEKVIFRDTVDHNEVQKFYAASDVYMCLSEYEPFGLAILEAMSMRVPVIATRNGGPLNIITHEYNGILVQPIDYSRIAYHIFGLLHNKEYRSVIINNAKGFVRHKYIWTSRAQDFLNAYRTATFLSQSGSKEPFLTHTLKHIKK